MNIFTQAKTTLEIEADGILTNLENQDLPLDTYLDPFGLIAMILDESIDVSEVRKVLDAKHLNHTLATNLLDSYEPIFAARYLREFSSPEEFAEWYVTDYLEREIPEEVYESIDWNSVYETVVREDVTVYFDGADYHFIRKDW